MKKTLLLCSIFWCTCAFSQITFNKSIGGAKDDKAYSVVEIFDEGYIVTGSKTLPSGITNLYLIRTDAYGDTLWTRTYGGTSYSCGKSISMINDNEFIITGYKVPYGDNKPDVYLIKANIFGDTLWTRTYGEGYYEEEGNSVRMTKDSGFIITGTFQTGYVLLIKTNSSGDTLWTKTYGANNDCRGISVYPTSDSGFIITGSKKIDIFKDEIYLIRTNSTGDTLWTKTYSRAGDSYGTSVVQTSDSGFIISGWTSDILDGESDICLIKTNPVGDTLWTKLYGGSDFDYGRSVVQTSDGGFIITGQSNSFGPGCAVYLIKTNLDGDTLWTKHFGGTSDAAGMCVVPASDGGYVVTGWNWTGSVLGNYNVLLIKTDANGLLSNIKDEASFSNTDRIMVFPNPSSGKINLNIPQKFGKTKMLEVYDCIGQSKITKTDNFTSIDISSLSNGLYFMVLTNSENVRMFGKIIKE